MSAADRSAEAFCTDLVRAQDFRTYAASLFVQPDARRAWMALAAFNAEVAHVRDHVSQPLPGEIRLQWWRDALTGSSQAADHGAVEGNPVAAELLRAMALYDLPAEAFVRLIDAHVFDVYDDPMPDMAALEAHCRDTAAAMYALRARVLGLNSPETARLAEHAGIAEGLVAAMLALPRHAARRQLYLPADLMNLHGVVAEEVFLHQTSAPLKEALAHLRREARAQLDQAMAMLADASIAVRPAFLPLAVIGKTLARLDTSEPFAPPTSSRLGVLWTTWRAASAKPFRV
ncbi:squalene/phytoene synthase family protein [Afipia massiliensis]|uniref:Squalene/phytoene synthase family protein n=1 Tax=Afipia massiliensis TaxID=211460 RepID=A0A4U6BS35_9BRAD|nr:squalene/phytoene synthase family protein [Afipia massiliensis]TKT73362.1 squalene/phytoene synthase family protein [Afipia massiliensis]